jgi:hypothetical protein
MAIVTKYSVAQRLSEIEKEYRSLRAEFETFQPKAGPAGRDGVSIVGPAGPRGEKGDTGATGAPGRDAVGIAGPAGRPGRDGADSIACEARVGNIETAIRELNTVVDGLRSELAAVNGRFEAHVTTIAGHNQDLRQKYHELLMRQAKENVERFRRQRHLA